MANVTVIVRGKYFDGCGSSDAGYVAEKINDIFDAETVTHFDCFKAGDYIVAVIVYTA